MILVYGRGMTSHDLVIRPSFDRPPLLPGKEEGGGANFFFSFFLSAHTPPWRGERAWPTKRVARLSPRLSSAGSFRPNHMQNTRPSLSKESHTGVRLVIYRWIVLPIDFLLWVASRIGTWSGLTRNDLLISLIDRAMQYMHFGWPFPSVTCWGYAATISANHSSSSLTIRHLLILKITSSNHSSSPYFFLI